MPRPALPASPPYVVLMTACIAPKAGVREQLVRADPALRLQDYKEALLSWLDLAEPRIGGIVFAENSGYPLDELQALVKTRASELPVEFLSFDHPAPDPGLHYGHTEFLLINAALASSRLAATFPYFIKATGRYRFPSISRLLRRLPRDYDIAVDCRGSDLPGFKRTRLATVALFLARRDFFRREVSDLPSRMEPAPPWTRKQFVENVLFDQLHARRREPGILLRWPCNCDPVGVGANGDQYFTPGKRLKNLVRGVLRRVFPPLWL